MLEKTNNCVTVKSVAITIESVVSWCKFGKCTENTALKPYSQFLFLKKPKQKLIIA